ncbi:MAG: sucrase ferredoxin, partial [Candidatus Binatia bacterium]
MAPESLSPSQDRPAPLCSRLSAERGLPLIGTAGFYDSVLAFEFEAPWAPRLVGSRAGDLALDAVLRRLSDDYPRLRLLAVEPGRARHGRVRILHLVRGQGSFREYRRREYGVDRDRLAATLQALAEGAVDEELRVSCADGLRDILVCTHGARDACCGKFGFGLYREFADLVRERGAGQAPVRVWRSSHLGGHRFAPTVLDLPSGRMFGRLAAGDAAAVLGGGAALARRLDAIYRGRCALPEAVQIAERELWTRNGPDFAGAGLRWECDAEADGWKVRLEADGGGAAACH